MQKKPYLVFFSVGLLFFVFVGGIFWCFCNCSMLRSVRYLVFNCSSSPSIKIQHNVLDFVFLFSCKGGSFTPYVSFYVFSVLYFSDFQLSQTCGLKVLTSKFFLLALLLSKSMWRFKKNKENSFSWKVNLLELAHLLKFV